VPPFSNGQPLKDDDANGTLPCIEKPHCIVEYGTSPLDIARFGVLPHCKNLFEARCVAYLDQDRQQIVDFRQKTYHHDSHSDPATIDDILRQGGISSQPPSIYVNDNGTLVVDGGRPVVVLPDQAPPLQEINFDQDSRLSGKGSSLAQTVQSAAPQVLSDPSPVRSLQEGEIENPPPPSLYNQQVLASKSIFKLFKALQTFTQTVVSNEQAQSVQLVTRLDGKRPVLLLNATRNDFLNFLHSLSKFNLITLKR